MIMISSLDKHQYPLLEDPGKKRKKKKENQQTSTFVLPQLFRDDDVLKNNEVVFRNTDHVVELVVSSHQIQYLEDVWVELYDTM